MPALVALGFAGGLLHVLNHAFFKCQLFYAAGAVYQASAHRGHGKARRPGALMPLDGPEFSGGRRGHCRAAAVQRLCQ
jgi:NADH:ubiquinone oxidoreductase subunit 5 (subunit L)/multisubunit Na+/H+ antiporter MnhA subunit